MKKIFVLFIMLSTVLVLTGCETLTPKSEFEIAMENMEALDSYEIEMMINNVPFFGSITAIIKIDGDKTETSILGMTTYSFEEDGNLYTIDEFEEVTYALLDFSTDEDEITEAFDIDEFTEEDFELNEDGEYVAIDVIDELEELTLVIVDGYFVEMRFKMESDGIIMEAEIEFEDFNEVEVELPAYEMASATQSALYFFDSEGFTFDYEGSMEDLFSVSLTSMGLNIMYIVDGDYFMIFEEFERYNYYPDTAEWQPEDGTAIALSEYLEQEDTVLPASYFRALDYLYENINN